MKNKIKTVILGKRSFISRALHSEINNSKIYSINEFIKKKRNMNEKFSIIINNSYPLKKLNHLSDYQAFFNKNIF